MSTSNPFHCYEGRYPCPNCGTKKTGTDVIATSAYYMDFLCHGCGHAFRKKAANVSPLSGSLSGFVEATE